MVFTLAIWRHNIANSTILNMVLFHIERIWQFTKCLKVLNPLSVMNSILTNIQLKTGIGFPTSDIAKTWCTRNLNCCNLQYRSLKHSLALVHCRATTLLSPQNMTLMVALWQTCKTISTSQLAHMKSTNISSVESRRSVSEYNMTTCWTKKPLYCNAQASKTGKASISSWLPCQIIRHLRSGNYTLWRMCNRMTINNSLSTTRIETSSHTYDGWCGRQPTPSF